LASGFLNPANNSNGASFGIWVSLPTGGDLIPLPVVTSMNEQVSSNALNVYPNPASDKLILSSGLLMSEKTTVTIYNSLGQIVLNQQIPANSTSVANIEIDNLANGFYTLEVIGNAVKSTSKISIVK